MSSDEAAAGNNEEYNSSTEDGASSSTSEEDEQFNRTPPSPNRKRHIDELASNNVFPGANQLRQPPPSATSQEQHNTDLSYSIDPSIIDPNLHASTLSYQTMGGGSWYFQPNDGSNLQLGSAYGSFPSTAYGSHPSQQSGQVPAYAIT